MENEKNLKFGKRAYSAEELKKIYDLADVKLVRSNKSNKLSVAMLPSGSNWDDDDAVLFGAVSTAIDLSKPIVYKECWHKEEDPEVDSPFIMAMNQSQHHFFDYFEEVRLDGNVSSDGESQIPF